MRWPFRRRDRTRPEAVLTPPAPQPVPYAVPPRPPRHWARIPPLTIAVSPRPPVLVPVLRLPDIAGTRSLLTLPVLRHPRKPAAGRVIGLARVRTPSDFPLSEAVFEQAVEIATSVSSTVEHPTGTVNVPVPVVPVRHVPVVECPRETRELVRAVGDNVGAARAPENEFRSVTDFDRLVAEVSGADLSSALGMMGLLGGASSVAAPPPSRTEQPTVAPVKPEQTLSRRSLGQSRRMGLQGPPTQAGNPDTGDESGGSEPEPVRTASEVTPMTRPRVHGAESGRPPPTTPVAPPEALVVRSRSRPQPSRVDSAETMSPEIVADHEPMLPPIPFPHMAGPSSMVSGRATVEESQVSVRPSTAEPTDIEATEPERPVARPVAMRRPRPLGLGAPIGTPIRPIGHRPERDTDHSVDDRIDLSVDQPVAVLGAEPSHTVAPPITLLDTHPADTTQEQLVHRVFTPAPEPPVRGTGGPVYRAALPTSRSTVDWTPPVGSPVVHDPVVHDSVEVTVPADVAVTFRSILGVEVGHVPVRRGRAVSRRARALGARAFAERGEVFLPDEAGPLEHMETKALLAHELAHAVQQRTLGADLPSEESVAGRQLEEAAVATERWFRGESGPPPELVHRPQPDVVTTGQMREFVTRASAEAVADRTPAGATQRAEMPLPDIRGSSSWSLGNGFTPAEAPAITSYPPIGPSAVDTLVAQPSWPPAEQSIVATAARPVGEDPLTRLRQLDAEVTELRERSAAPVPDFDDARTLDSLAGKLYRFIRGRLRAELIVDRERTGRLADSW
jgi:hypothetical protein